jgi:hypothetical protein
VQTHLRHGVVRFGAVKPSLRVLLPTPIIGWHGSPMNIGLAILAVIVLFAQAAAGNPIVEKIIQTYQDECVANVESDLRLEGDRDPDTHVELAVYQDSVYQLSVGVGTDATVVFANFSCPNLKNQ